MDGRGPFRIHGRKCDQIFDDAIIFNALVVFLGVFGGMINICAWAQLLFLRKSECVPSKSNMIEKTQLLFFTKLGSFYEPGAVKARNFDHENDLGPRGKPRGGLACSKYAQPIKHFERPQRVVFPDVAKEGNQILPTIKECSQRFETGISKESSAALLDSNDKPATPADLLFVDNTLPRKRRLDNMIATFDTISPPTKAMLKDDERLERKPLKSTQAKAAKATKDNAKRQVSNRRAEDREKLQHAIDFKDKENRISVPDPARGIMLSA